MKFISSIKKNQLVVKGKASRSESMSQGQIKNFQDRSIPGFLQIQEIKGRTIKYVAPECMTLNYFFSKPVTSIQFYESDKSEKNAAI